MAREDGLNGCHTPSRKRITCTDSPSEIDFGGSCGVRAAVRPRFFQQRKCSVGNVRRMPSSEQNCRDQCHETRRGEIEHTQESPYFMRVLVESQESSAENRMTAATTPHNAPRSCDRRSSARYWSLLGVLGRRPDSLFFSLCGSNRRAVQIDSRLRCIDIASLIMARRAEWRRSQSRRRSPPRRKRRARPQSGGLGRRRPSAESRERLRTHEDYVAQVGEVAKRSEAHRRHLAGLTATEGVGEIEAPSPQIRSRPAAKSGGPC
jgi:hypothetical protein